MAEQLSFESCSANWLNISRHQFNLSVTKEAGITILQAEIFCVENADITWPQVT